jgi:hypothetical protein
MTNDQQNRNYNIPQQMWNNFDDRQRQTFSRVYEQERSRRQELIQNLNPECQDMVRQYFDEIVGSIIADVVSHNTLEPA